MVEKRVGEEIEVCARLFTIEWPEDESVLMTYVQDEDWEEWFRLHWRATRRQVEQIARLLVREWNRGELCGKEVKAAEVRRVLGVTG